MTETKALFSCGDAGCHTYRIPTILTLPDGKILAFCEARQDGLGDAGTIRIALRCSEDGGETFSPIRFIADAKGDTIGNPAPVYDRDTGRIWLWLNTNLASGPEPEILLMKAPRTVGYIYSDDQGGSWSEFVDMTARLKKPDWTWYAAGPCHALQTKSGRLVIPCNHGEFDFAEGRTTAYRCHTILSDDHGVTWRLGGTVPVIGNEVTVEELADGRLYLNARTQHPLDFRLFSHRMTAYSRDGGESWEDICQEDPHLPDPHCQGSVIAYPHAVKGCARPLLFSNNPNPMDTDWGGRYGLTLRISLDNGKSWSDGLKISEGPTAYGDLTVLPDGRIGVLFERGEEHPYESICFTTAALEELL